jgi:hypothetical protein
MDIPLAKGSNVGLMGNHDDRNPQIPVEMLKDLHDLYTRPGVKIARRLIR